MYPSGGGGMKWFGYTRLGVVVGSSVHCKIKLLIANKFKSFIKRAFNILH